MPMRWATTFSGSGVKLTDPQTTDYGGTMTKNFELLTFEEFLNRNQADSRRPSVPLEAFAQENFLLLKEGNDIHQRSLQICKNAGFIPNVSLYLTQMMTAYYLVCEGQGITFLRSTIPAHVAPTDKVVFYQLGDSLAVRSIYLSYTKRNTNPVQQHLIDFMKDSIL